MNKIFIIGNLAKDPELSVTSTGTALCRMTVAVNRRFSNNDGERDVDFFNVVVWRALGENCGKYLHKGSKVAVCGSLNNRSFEGQDGVKRYFTEITADDVEFLSPKGEGDNSGSGSNGTVDKLEPISDTDLPF